MPENKYLDMFTSRIDERGYPMTGDLKQEIMLKTYRKIRKGWFNYKTVAAACAAIILLSAFIPNTPVSALCRKLFSFIPGIGIVQSTEETGRITCVLEEPVKVSEGNQFVEIKTAYVVDETLRVSIKTNVGTEKAGELASPEELKEFFAGETAPALYLLCTEGKLKSGHTMWSGPSLETRVYSIEAAFDLPDGDINSKVFKFELEGFNQTAEINMSAVTSDTLPQTVGNAALIDDVMVFANASREGEVLEVLLSSVAPQDFKNVRFHLFDLEKQVFERGVYITDKEGNIYYPDDELREKNNSGINNLFFIIPQDKDGLKLVVPQILYSRADNVNGIKLTMPQPGREQRINRELDLPGSTVLIEKASLIPANDPMLPEEFERLDCLRIDASAETGKNNREKVLRVLPRVEIPDGIIGFRGVSHSTYGELWNESSRGYSLTEFDNMSKTEKIMLTFDVEYAMIGPWEIELQIK